MKNSKRTYFFAHPMSFQTLYSELVAAINSQSGKMEVFSQMNYDWLEKVVSELGLREVRVMRQSLSPVPQLIASAEIVDTPLKPPSDEESLTESPDEEDFPTNPNDGDSFLDILDDNEGDDSSDSDQFQTVAKTRVIDGTWDSLEGFHQYRQPMTAPTRPPIEIPQTTSEATKNPIAFADGTNLLDAGDSQDEPVHTMRFVDAGDLRLSLDPSSLGFLREEAKEANVSNMLSQLSSSAAQFREKWKGIVQEKNLETQSAKTVTGDSYQMSDHDDDDDEDLEMFDKDPEEVHGKTVPSWARAANLEKQLRKQKTVDPDTIFSDFSMTCALTDVFNAQNPRWTTRNESQMWDCDACSPEELRQFKQLLGLL